MQQVAHSDVDRPGFARHHDRVIAQGALRPQQGQYRTDRDHDRRDGDTGRQRQRLRADGIVEHPHIAAHQRVFDSAREETMPTDL